MVIFPIVNIGLAVGDDQDFVPGQVIVQDRLECGGRPAHLTFIPHALVRFETVDQGAELLRHRLQFGNVPLPADQFDEAFAPQHGLHARYPASPAQMRNEHRHQ